jgi:hypothetical protein
VQGEASTAAPGQRTHYHHYEFVRVRADTTHRQSDRHTLWVPETRLKPADLLRQVPMGVRHDPPVTLRLIYQMFSKLLG